MNKAQAMQVLESIQDDEPVFILRASRRTDHAALQEKIASSVRVSANAETHVYLPYQVLQRFRAWDMHHPGEAEN